MRRIQSHSSFFKGIGGQRWVKDGVEDNEFRDFSPFASLTINFAKSTIFRKMWRGGTLGILWPSRPVMGGRSIGSSQFTPIELASSAHDLGADWGLSAPRPGQKADSGGSRASRPCASRQTAGEDKHLLHGD
jgi:hypothetical protein